MKSTLRLTFLLSISIFQLTAYASVVCDRQKVQQDILFARSSPFIQEYAKLPQIKPQHPVSSRLDRIFRDLEMKTFGIRFMRIEDFPLWPGLTIFKNRIQFSSLTDKQLLAKLKNPDIGAAFEIAHEMGHLVQNISRVRDGLRKIETMETPETYNPLHAEIDCIGVEILHQAGYPLTQDILDTLSLITEECKAEQTLEFCEHADKLRKDAVREYMRVITE